jgi:predicted  nucleic acid-binding Zn-ribbon protein
MQRRLRILLAVLSVGGCQDQEAVARADTLEVRLTEQQSLANQLAAQKDSLVRVVLDADAFLGQMDSAISTVKGLPRSRRGTSDPLADQLQARKDMQQRVNALVARAKVTAEQLSALQRKAHDTQSQNVAIREQLTDQMNKIEADAQLITDLGATIERQNLQIATLESRLDSLSTEVRALGTKLYKAYYVVGTEKELTDKGVVQRVGGANLLIARPGRTLVPAQLFNPDSFTVIDQREIATIPVPDTTARYRIITRQNLDAAQVTLRDGMTFRGPIRITRPEEFWAQSRFLILVKQ